MIFDFVLAGERATGQNNATFLNLLRSHSCKGKGVILKSSQSKARWIQEHGIVKLVAYFTTNSIHPLPEHSNEQILSIFHLPSRHLAVPPFFYSEILVAKYLAYLANTFLIAFGVGCLTRKSLFLEITNESVIRCFSIFQQ